jgi:hypothetical protein
MGALLVSNRQPVLYLDELLGSYRRPVPTEIVNLLYEERSAQTSKCIMVPVHIRLPFLNTPQCKRGCVKRGKKIVGKRTLDVRAIQSELPPFRHTSSGPSKSDLTPPFTCALSSHGFRIPAPSICAVSCSIIAATAASAIRFLAKGKVKRLRGNWLGVYMSTLRHMGHSTCSCHPPHVRWNREKKCLTMHSAQKV